MSVRVESAKEAMTAYLDGEIDHHTAKGIREEIDAAVQAEQPTLLILDFRDVTFMDSSGIGLVMGRYKLVSKGGGELHISNPSPQIAKVMRLAGLNRLAVIDQGGKRQ